MAIYLHPSNATRHPQLAVENNTQTATENTILIHWETTWEDETVSILAPNKFINVFMLNKTPIKCVIKKKRFLFLLGKYYVHMYIWSFSLHVIIRRQIICEINFNEPFFCVTWLVNNFSHKNNWIKYKIHCFYEYNFSTKYHKY